MSKLPLPSPGARLSITVEAVDDEGRGRAQIGGDGPDGYDIAVRGGFPGDMLRCVVERVWRGRRLVQARTGSLDAPGKARVKSACPHGPPCPGCPLEGAEPSLALDLKRDRVVEALADAGLEAAAELVDDVLTRAEGDRRQKVKLMVGGQPGRLLFGLYAPHSHNLAPAEGCPHYHHSLEPALAMLRGALDEHRVAPGPSGLKAVLARAFEEGVGAVLLVGQPLSDDTWAAMEHLVEAGALASIAERVYEGPGNSLMGGEIERHAGPEALSPLEGGPEAPVDAFCQPDPELAQQMYALCGEWVAGAGPGRVLDAYAGTGGFARGVLEASDREILAVERSTSAQGALAATGALAVEGEVADTVAELLSVTGEPTERWAAVIADPPRKGLGPEAEALARLKAERFALISCDPDALAADLKVLLEEGYRVARILPVDLFAASPQVETVTFLERA